MTASACGIFSLLALVAAVFISTSGLRADVIYRETFGNATAGNQGLSQINTDWKVYTSASGINETATRPVVSNTASAPSGELDNIGTGKTTNSTTNGIAYVSAPTDGLAFFATTSFTAKLDPATLQGITFSWYAGNNTTAVTHRLAVQIGSTWYVTDQTFSNTTAVTAGGNFGTGAEKMTFSFTTDAAAWRDLTLVAGTALSVSSTARTLDLPAGEITGFGILMECGNGTGRFDTFEISATTIPEPGTCAMIFGGLSFVCVVAWQRRVASRRADL